MSDARSKVLISARDLAARREAGEKIVVLEVRDERATEPAERMFAPMAIATCLDTDYSGPATKDGGKRPLPDIAGFQAKVREWGVDSDALVVVYDNAAGAQASRAWWTFRWAGFANVRILDGGFAGWRGAGFPEANSALKPPGGGDAVLSAGHMPTLDADQAAALAKSGGLLDARGRAAYLGAPAEAGKPKTGHIPGALSAPSSDGVAANGHFKTADELRGWFDALHGDEAAPLGLYCGSGNAASHLMAALHVAGREAALYVGSWSAWSADPDRPAATGLEPG